MDFTTQGPKLLQLLYGLIAFVIVVGGLLLLLDVVPTWLSNRRQRREAAQAERRAAHGAAPTLEKVAGRPLGRFRALLLKMVPARLRRRASRPYRRRREREGLFALGFLLPALLLLTVGLVIPAIRTTILSFMDKESQSFVGLANYDWMFTQEEIIDVIVNTMIWVVLVPTVATSIGLIYAVLVDRARMEALAKSLIFMPMAISFVGASIIWKFVYAYRSGEQEQIGLLNQIVVMFGGTPQQWLLDDRFKLNTLLLIVVLVWIQAGFAMVILSAAIKAIPADIVEAARLDGVNAWQMFWRVTMPSIRPALIVVVVTISIGTLKVFDIVRTMTNGNFNTNVIANEMYNQAFRYGERGQGSALAVFLFVLVIPIVIYQIRILRKRQQEA